MIDSRMSDGRDRSGEIRGRRPARPAGCGLVLLLALLGSPLHARAQQPDTIPPDSVYEVEGISVRVARPTATVGGASAVTARLDSLPTPPAPTLEEVLRRLPLIQIRENSRGEAQPSLRGVEARQIAVLVDGVPLTLGWDDRADLSVVPLSAAREVTLIRGLSSVLAGPNALGGVIKVGLSEGASLPIVTEPFRFSAGIDHLGNEMAALDLGTRFRPGPGELAVRAGAGYRNRSDLPVPSLSPARGRTLSAESGDRLNSDLEHVDGFLVGRYHAPGGAWVSVSSFGFRAEKGVPPELHVQEPRIWRIPSVSRWVTALSAGTGWRRTPLGEGDIEASLGVDLGDTEIDTYESLAFDSITGGERGDDRTLSMRLLADHTLGPGTLHTALTLAETRHVETLEPGGRATYRQRLWSLGLEVEQPVSIDDVGASRGRVSAGLSLDGADTPETGGRPPRDRIWDWGARAGGTLALASGRMLMHGGASRRVRFPALRELYSGALGRFVPNPDLSAEVLLVAELGLTARIGRLQGQAVAFHQRLSDAIVRASVGDGQFQRQNRDEIRSTGIELLARYGRGPVFLMGDLTVQDVGLHDPSAPEDERHAEYQPAVAGGLELGSQLPLKASGTLGLRHRGRQYCVHPDLEREVTLNADTWVDARLDRTFRVGGGRQLDLSLVLENATDAAVFDQCGLPQPGRILRVEFRIF